MNRVSHVSVVLIIKINRVNRNDGQANMIRAFNAKFNSQKVFSSRFYKVTHSYFYFVKNLQIMFIVAQISLFIE